MASKEMASDEMTTDDMASNEMIADEMISTDMAANEMALNDLTANGIASNGMASNGMAITDIATGNMAISNAAINNTQTVSQGIFIPNEIWSEIISHLRGPSRMIGVAPDLDNRALRHSVPPIAQVNHQIRSVFQTAYVNVGSSTLQPTHGILSVDAYISPDHDTMTLGYGTNDPDSLADLIQAPRDDRLASKLKKVWLADLNIPHSAGYFGIDPVIANRPVNEIERFPLGQLIYRSLEVITLSSEKYDSDLKDEDELSYGFDIVYHVQTGLIFMNQIHNFQEGEWVNARSGSKDFNAQESFLARIKIDRSDDLSQINVDSFQAVIREKDAKRFDPKDDPLADIEEASGMWRYNWQICLDYIELRLV